MADDHCRPTGERLIADAVLYRLETTDLADTPSGRASADDRTRELTRALDEDQEQLEELAAAYAARRIKMREWMVARQPIEQRLATTQHRLGQTTRTGALSGLVGNGQQLGRSWNTLNLDDNTPSWPPWSTTS